MAFATPAELKDAIALDLKTLALTDNPHLPKRYYDQCLEATSWPMQRFPFLVKAIPELAEASTHITCYAYAGYYKDRPDPLITTLQNIVRSPHNRHYVIHAGSPGFAEGALAHKLPIYIEKHARGDQTQFYVFIAEASQHTNYVARALNILVQQLPKNTQYIVLDHRLHKTAFGCDVFALDILRRCARQPDLFLHTLPDCPPLEAVRKPPITIQTELTKGIKGESCQDATHREWSSARFKGFVSAGNPGMVLDTDILTTCRFVSPTHPAFPNCLSQIVLPCAQLKEDEITALPETVQHCPSDLSRSSMAKYLSGGLDARGNNTCYINAAKRILELTQVLLNKMDSATFARLKAQGDELAPSEPAICTPSCIASAVALVFCVGYNASPMSAYVGNVLGLGR